MERQEIYQELELQMLNIKKDFRQGLENFQSQVSQQLQCGWHYAANTQLSESAPDMQKIEMQNGFQGWQLAGSSRGFSFDSFSSPTENKHVSAAHDTHLGLDLHVSVPNELFGLFLCCALFRMLTSRFCPG